MLKLLKKSEINSLKEKDRQMEINEGVKLAKRVDSLRQAQADEELALEKFRRESVLSINNEIIDLSSKKESLAVEVLFLEQERIRLSAPIDLQIEWAKIASDKKEIGMIKEENHAKEVSLLAREVENEVSRKEFEKREVELGNKESLTIQYLLGAEEHSKKALSFLKEAENTKNNSIVFKEKVLKEMEDRDMTVSSRERDLKNKEQKIERDQKELNEEKKKVLDQRRTLERAFNRLKK